MTVESFVTILVNISFKKNILSRPGACDERTFKLKVSLNCKGNTF